MNKNNTYLRVYRKLMLYRESVSYNTIRNANFTDIDQYIFFKKVII